MRQADTDRFNKVVARVITGVGPASGSSRRAKPFTLFRDVGTGNAAVISVAICNFSGR